MNTVRARADPVREITRRGEIQKNKFELQKKNKKDESVCVGGGVSSDGGGGEERCRVVEKV